VFGLLVINNNFFYQIEINVISLYLSYWWTEYERVTESHYRPAQALRVPGWCGSQISWQSAHEGGKVVSRQHRPPLPPPPPPRKYSWPSFLFEAESTPVPQCGRKEKGCINDIKEVTLILLIIGSFLSGSEY
jgi:hypothetical protein